MRLYASTHLLQGWPSIYSDLAQNMGGPGEKTTSQVSAPGPRLLSGLQDILRIDLFQYKGPVAHCWPRQGPQAAEGHNRQFDNF